MSKIDEKTAELTERGMNDMLIFVSSPDIYSDVFSVFLQCFARFCKDCPYDFVLSTNTNKFDGITVYNNGAKNDSWMDRAYPVLHNLHVDYMLFLCDDLIITEKVDFTKINLILKEMKEKNINFCGLTNFIRGRRVSKDSLLSYVKKNMPYAKNLQSGIVKRSYFLNMLENGDKSPWELEVQWLKEASKAPDEYYDDVVSCKENILHCENGVRKGKWSWLTVHKLRKLGITVNTDKREVIPLVTEVKSKVFSFIGKKIPATYRPMLKKIANHMGQNFFSEF